MLLRDLSRILGLFFLGFSIPLLLPLMVALYCEVIKGPAFYPQPPAALAFFLTILTSLALGGLLFFFGRKVKGHLYRKEGLLLVVLVYLLFSAVGTLPFLYSGTLSSFTDGFFESVSGFTTTGATVLEGKRFDPHTNEEIPLSRTVLATTPTDYRYYGNIAPVVDASGQEKMTGIEAMNEALLFWRGEMQLLGGGGIVILFLAILPILGVGGKVLYQTETTGPSKETLTPRIKETASWVWKSYLALTLSQVILLMLTNHQMPFLDAVDISFATLSTGGFSPKNASIAAYNNAYTDWITILFMILGSFSFSLYFFAMKGRFSKLNDPELKLFLFLLAAASLFTTFVIYGTPVTPLCAKGEGTYSFFEALRYSTFQVVSSMSTTGFSTANFDLWPFSAQATILIVMFIGGMAGSTAGGIKVIRLELFYKILREKLRSIYRPDSVRSYHLGKRIIEEKSAMTLLCFLLVVVSSLVIGTFLFILDGVDPETAFTTTSCMLNNCGFAFRMGGPETNFAFLSSFGKILSSILMLAGRLEYFALLILLLPSFWKRV